MNENRVITFPKDILIVDFETSHKQLEKAEPLQIGAILLDKNTLKEKKNFKSYIYNDLINALPETLAINGITQEFHTLVTSACLR